MPRILIGVTALLISALPVQAQSPQQGGQAQNRPSAEQLKALTDARIEMTKFALQLTPAQEKLWPAVEEAMRARAAMRQQRLITLAVRLSDDKERNPFEVLRERADMLGQRGAALKKVVDAWQPLYDTLDARQKMRLQAATAISLREAKEAVQSRMEDSDDWDW